MKNILLFLTILILISSCNSEQSSSTPDTLEAKQKLLQEKKATLATLKQEIKALEANIEKQNPNKTETTHLVSTQPVVQKDVHHYVEIQGTVQADDLVNVTTEVPGRILQLTVQEGQNIRKGMLIAKIDMEQLAKQKAELEKSLELATEIFTRQKRLWDQKIGSEIQFLQAKNAKERLEKSLETLSYQQSKSNIYAPISGIAERVIAKAGELASPGMPIVQILNTSKLKVVADVPETYLAAVKRGDKVKINFPAIDKEITTKVTLIGKTIDPSNRTFKVEAALRNSGGIYKPNLLALMSVNDFTVKDALTVPLSVVQQTISGGSYIFVVDSTGNKLKAKKVEIEVGESVGNEVIVKKGLKGSETIVFEGARFINDGEVITVK